MKKLIAVFGCALLVAALSPAVATAQATKTVKGSVAAVAGDSITVKVAGKDMTFAVDTNTKVVAPGGSTATRAAKAQGKAGPALVEIVKTGQTVEVDYHEQGMHAAAIRTIAAVLPVPASMAPKALTASGVVSAVTGNSLTVKGKDGEWTFVIDSKTKVSGTGLGTASRQLSEAGGKPTLGEFVHDGDTVTVTYNDMIGGTKNASLVRITRKKM